MLQPNMKSCWYYLAQWYIFWSWKQLDEFSINLLQTINLFDDSILLVDDIIDESKTRNNNPCLYIQIGIPWTIIQSELLKKQATNALIELMAHLNTNWDNQLQVFRLLHEYFWNIYEWENLWLKLTSIDLINNDTVNKYFTMIKLFTWWHIDYFLRIWQLIANKEVNSSVIELSISLGIIRQICDDFDDYFSWHHEPFWDFISKSKRLPEILFLLQWWNREEIEKLILLNKIKEARNIVLSKKVKEQLYNFCSLEHQKIKNIQTTFNYNSLIENYEKIIQ